MSKKVRTFLLVFAVGLPPLLFLGAGGWVMLRSSLQTAAGETKGPEQRLHEIKNELETAVARLVLTLNRQKEKIKEEARKSDPDIAGMAGQEGVLGVFQMNLDGKVEKKEPHETTVVDEQYASTAEFQNLKNRLADPSSEWPYVFFSSRLGKAVFQVIQPTGAGSLLGVILDIGTFLKTPSFPGVSVFLILPERGLILHHPDPSLLAKVWPMAQETAGLHIREALKAGRGGVQREEKGGGWAWAPSGIGNLGVVAEAPAALLNTAQKDKGAFFSLEPAALLTSPLGAALLAALVWLFFWGGVLSRKAGDSAKAKFLFEKMMESGDFSTVPLGKVGDPHLQGLLETAVGAVAKLQEEKQMLVKQKEGEIAGLKNQLSQQNNQIQEAASKLGNLKSQLEEAQRQLSEKLKELEAQKSIATGLRNQNEQTQKEFSKLKNQVSMLEQEKQNLQNEIQSHVQKAKDMETRLLQALSQAATIQASKVRVAAIRTMAEELKTTLGIIKGYVSSALGSAGAGLSEKQQEFLGMVINRSARLEKFINDLVDVFQVEIEQEDAPREKVSLSKEIEALTFNYQAQLEIKNLKIQVVEKEKVPEVAVIRRRFTQLWNVLLLQVIKDAPRGSNVSIVVEPFSEGAKVVVHDPGLTVQPQHLEHLFDEFYDPKHPASPQLAGTGLKFALVKAVVAAHGGVAAAEKGDQGTRLVMTFPMSGKPAKEKAPAAPAGIPASTPAPLKPTVSGAPQQGRPSATETTTPKPGLLDTLLKKEKSEGALAAPPMPAAAPPPAAPGLPKPPLNPPAGLPGAPKGIPPSPAPGGLKPPAPGKPFSPPSLKPPSPPGTSPAAPPPSPKVVPTSLRPTKPPPGVLDLDSMDTLKLDEESSASKKAPPSISPAAPPSTTVPGGAQAPKPPLPPPGAPRPGLKPPPPGSPGPSITKDLKDAGGKDELIE